MESDLVSICIPAYNAEKTIESTLQSILNQSYRNLEIIIVDNASTDSTLSIVQRFKDSRTRIYRNDRNIGAEANFTKCVELASGEYIAIFHADDMYLPDIVEKEVRAFLDNPSLGAVFTGASYINEHGKVIGRNKLPAKLRGRKLHHFPKIFIHMMEQGNFLITPSCMVRGTLYKKLMPFDKSRFGVNADFDVWLRLLKESPIVILEEKLMHYRISNEGGSYPYRYSWTGEAGFFKVMDYHLSLNSGMVEIPQATLGKYKFQRSLDRIIRAVNFLVKGQPEEAKTLLKQSISGVSFRAVMGSVKKPKLLGFWIFGLMLLVLVYISLGHYQGEGLHWLLYKRGKVV